MKRSSLAPSIPSSAIKHPTIPTPTSTASSTAPAALILSRQEKDGSWWDYPLYDYHQPYGTGYCFMALAWFKDAMGKP